MTRLATTDGLTEQQQEILDLTRTFVEKEILPVATSLEHRDEYPTDIVEGLKESESSGSRSPRSTAAWVSRS